MGRSTRERLRVGNGSAKKNVLFNLDLIATRFIRPDGLVVTPRPA
jgi:hypothetical protein